MLQSVMSLPFRKVSPMREVGVCFSPCLTGGRLAVSCSRDSEFAFLCAFAFSSEKRLLASSCLSVRVRQISSHWTDFSEI